MADKPKESSDIKWSENWQVTADNNDGSGWGIAPGTVSPSNKDKDSVTFPWDGISTSIWNLKDHNEQEYPSSTKFEDVVQDDQYPALDNTTTLSNASSGLGLTGSYVISNGTSGNVYVGGTTIGGGGGGPGSYGNITFSNPSTWTNSISTTPPAHGDIEINGKSLKDFMEKVEQRLAILTPNIEKLEHFQALREAYEHYKTLEALCIMPRKDDNSK